MNVTSGVVAHTSAASFGSAASTDAAYRAIICLISALAASLSAAGGCAQETASAAATHASERRRVRFMPFNILVCVSSLQQTFGNIDIYLFDQLLRGRIAPGMRVFDAGCGGGRNLAYLLREGYEVFGVDGDPRAVEATRRLDEAVAENFRAEPVESHSFPDAFAEVV